MVIERIVQVPCPSDVMYLYSSLVEESRYVQFSMSVHPPGAQTVLLVIIS